MKQVETLEGSFWVWDQDHQGQVIEAQGWWDGHLKPFIDEVASKERWAIDVGASIGWFTRYFAKKFRGVVAVEAHPGTYKILEMNTEGRGVVLLQGAAYDGRVLDLVQAPDSWLGWTSGDPEHCPNTSSLAFVRSADLTGNGTSKVRTRTVHLDSAIDSILPVGLIKLDTQGCDLRALFGLSQTIALHRPRIIFEFERAAASWHGDTWEDYAGFFAERDYSIRHVREDVVDWVADPKEGLK
jgi:FkbM family methyltransferase